MRQTVFIVVTTLLLLSPLAYATSTQPAALTLQDGVIFAGQKPAMLAGNSLFWSNTGWGGEKFYTDNTVRMLQNEWKSNVVRIPIGVETPGGYLEKPEENMKRAEVVINSALKRNMYVIVDWHSHEAEKHEEAAHAFFRKISEKYGKHNNIIYEIYNEPLKVSWTSTIKPYAERIIRVIRKNDSTNLIVVGTSNWSQDVDIASTDPINDSNTAYALHFYAGSHGKWLIQKATVALQNKLPLFVTEWGTVNAEGTGNVNEKQTQEWMTFLRSNKISHVNWSINDKNEGASALQPGILKLTPSGKLAKSIIIDWQQQNINASTETDSF